VLFSEVDSNSLIHDSFELWCERGVPHLRCMTFHAIRLAALRLGVHEDMFQGFQTYWSCQACTLWGTYALAGSYPQRSILANQ
jgi:hypothetical protein